MKTLVLALLATALAVGAPAQQTASAEAKTKPPFVIPPDVNGLRTVIPPVVSQRALKVAVFSGKGSPQSSVDAVVKAVGFIPQATPVVLKGGDIGRMDLKSFDVIVFPGGSGSGQSKTLGEAGLKNVREFVRGGGGYVGICAGAYLACSNFSWGLGILNAGTVSNQWRRGLGIVEAEPTDAAPTVLGKVGGRFKVRYNNGPILKSGDRSDLPPYTVLTLFRTEMAENGTPVGAMVNTPAQAIATFGKGRVFVSSPHPEGTPGLEHLIPRGIVWASGQEP